MSRIHRTLLGALLCITADPWTNDRSLFAQSADSDAQSIGTGETPELFKGLLESLALRRRTSQAGMPIDSPAKTASSNRNKELKGQGTGRSPFRPIGNSNSPAATAQCKACGSARIDGKCTSGTCSGSPGAGGGAGQGKSPPGKKTPGQGTPGQGPANQGSSALAAKGQSTTSQSTTGQSTTGQPNNRPSAGSAKDGSPQSPDNQSAGDDAGRDLLASSGLSRRTPASGRGAEPMPGRTGGDSPANVSSPTDTTQADPASQAVAAPPSRSNRRTRRSAANNAPPTGPSLGGLPFSPTDAQGIAQRAAAIYAAAQSGPNGGQNTNNPMDVFADLANAVHAGAAVAPGMRWKVVKPAGSSPAAAQVAVNVTGGETDDQGDGQRSYQLDIGVVRSDLLTGPKNPLLVPPGVASVVYVIDISGSMAGQRYSKVARAVNDAVSQLNPNQQFAVLLFNSLALQIDDGGLLHATDSNKQLLATQLQGVLPVGATDPTDALLIAIQMKPETIVVFSDGEFDHDAVEKVTALNRSSGSQIQINCVAVQSSVEVLKRLSTLNGPGNYIEVR